MSPHSTHLERWLGPERIAHLQSSMRGWYGPPIGIADVPGEVSICGDGDFIGRIDGGEYFSGLDAIRAIEIKRRKDQVRAVAVRRKQSGMAGFASLSDLMSEITVAGKTQPVGGTISKIGTTGVVLFSNSLWRVGNSPAAGAAAAAAPGGTVQTSASTGAMAFTNPPSGDLQSIVTADMLATAGPNALLLYSRIFAVAIDPNSNVNQAVTGVPTLYQSTTGGAANSIPGNFLFFEVGTQLAATAHTITFTYVDQAGNTAEVAPVVTGSSAAIANRFDHPGFFCPLNASDSGIKNLTNVILSAAVATGTMDAVIGHPHVFMAFTTANLVTPFDWVFQRFQPSRIFDDACLALIEVQKPITTATTYSGVILSAWG